MPFSKFGIPIKCFGNQMLFRGYKQKLSLGIILNDFSNDCNGAIIMTSKKQTNNKLTTH